MKTSIKAVLATLVVSLGFVGVAQAATVPVNSLDGSQGWSATNSTVTKGADGVHFGTYADGGALGGTLLYSGFNGHPLSDIDQLNYTFSYRVGSQPAGYTAAPYLRVFLDTNDDGDVDSDVILDPGNCATQDVPQSTFITLEMVGYPKLRYNDDGCDSLANQFSWGEIQLLHGDETIVGILVSQGNSVGTDVSALVTQVSLNGTTFAFNVPPANGQNGAPGETGQQGARGGNGVNGGKGDAGANGVTTFINSTQGNAAPKVCKGDQVRHLHAASRKGLKFVEVVKAVLRSKHISSNNIDGREVDVDLRNRDAGNFNVKITAKYRSKKTGRVVSRSETRHLSVVCS